MALRNPDSYKTSKKLPDSKLIEVYFKSIELKILNLCYISTIGVLKQIYCIFMLTLAQSFRAYFKHTFYLIA